MQGKVTLIRLFNRPKMVRAVYEMLRYQPREHYQAWGYGSPTMASVRTLLSANSVFGILLNEQLVGIIGFRYQGRYFIPLYNGQYWVHYLVDKNYTNRGIITEAMRLFLQWVADETPLTRLYASIYSYNLNSIHIIKKFGFVKRGQRGDTEVFERIIQGSPEL